MKTSSPAPAPRAERIRLAVEPLIADDGPRPEEGLGGHHQNVHAAPPPFLKSSRQRAVGSTIVRENHAVLALQSQCLQILRPYRLAARHCSPSPKQESSGTLRPRELTRNRLWIAYLGGLWDHSRHSAGSGVLRACYTGTWGHLTMRQPGWLGREVQEPVLILIQPRNKRPKRPGIIRQRVCVDP